MGIVLAVVLAPPATAFVSGVQARGCAFQSVVFRVSEAPAMFGGGSGAKAKKVVAKKVVKRVTASNADNGVIVDGYLARSAAELFTPENRVPATVGAFFLVGQLTQPLVGGLDRLGLIKLPPLNALTSI